MYIVSHFCAVCSPSVVGNFLKCCIQYYLMCVFMQKIVDLLFMLYMFITFRLEILCSHSYPFYLLAKCFFRSDIQCMQVTASCGSSVGVVEYAHTISWPSVARSDKTSVAFVVCVCCVVFKSNQIELFYSGPKVDQRAGQLSLPHLGITKTEKIELKHKTDEQIGPVNSLEP